jgi:hypothetical protein
MLILVSATPVVADNRRPRDTLPNTEYTVTDKYHLITIVMIPINIDGVITWVPFTTHDYIVCFDGHSSINNQRLYNDVEIGDVVRLAKYMQGRNARAHTDEEL